MSVPLALDCQYALHIKICFAFILLLIVDNLVFTNPFFLFLFFNQGGNDHEIYESERTVGHTGQSKNFISNISMGIYNAIRK